jgi:hypothetical protein
VVALFVLNHVATKKQVSDVFVIAVTRVIAADMRTAAVAKEVLVVEIAIQVADTIVIVGLAQVDRIEALQNAVLVVEKDALLAETEVQPVVQLEALADALADGNSKKVVLRKRSTNF